MLEHTYDIHAARVAYERLLLTLDPAIADILRKKFDEDETEFIEALRSFSPSMEVSYWAKSSCRRCHGTGFVGSRGGTQVACTCAHKRFRTWLLAFRLWYNALKEQNKKGSV